MSGSQWLGLCWRALRSQARPLLVLRTRLAPTAAAESAIHLPCISRTRRETRAVDTTRALPFRGARRRSFCRSTANGRGPSSVGSQHAFWSVAAVEGLDIQGLSSRDRGDGGGHSLPHEARRATNSSEISSAFRKVSVLYLAFAAHWATGSPPALARPCGSRQSILRVDRRKLAVHGLETDFVVTEFRPQTRTTLSLSRGSCEPLADEIHFPIDNAWRARVDDF